MISSATRLSICSSDGSGSLWNMTQRLPVTTFIGAGGKTTCLRSITSEIQSTGLQVVATTTTKVYPEKHMIAWENLNPPPQQKSACFWYAQVEEKSGKWVGPSVAVVDAAIREDLLHHKRYWVIEGDGARGHKLKCWESYEPQIPKCTDCAVLVLDRKLWGSALKAEQVHRPEACSDLLGKVWNAESAWSYFLRSPVFAPQYAHMAWVILMNSSSKNLDNMDYTGSINSKDLLQGLWDRWVEIQQNPLSPEKRPKHLRLAAGDAKEGDLRWSDLW